MRESVKEARFDDLAKFSSLLWQWMQENNNEAVIRSAIERAFSLYQEDLRCLKIPLGDPDALLAGEDFCMLCNFDDKSFESLVGYLKAIAPGAQDNELKKKLISRILNISLNFEKKYQRWRTIEFSQREFDILKIMLETASTSHPDLMKKLLYSEEEQDQTSMQSYVNLFGRAAVQIASQTGNIVKYAAATVYCAAMDQLIHNSAAHVQIKNQSAKSFLFESGNTGSWEKETSVRYLARDWPSLNMRMIDAVCHAFYHSQVISSDAVAGEEKSLKDMIPSQSARVTNDALGQYADEQYIVLPQLDEQAGSAPPARAAQDPIISNSGIGNAGLGALNLFASNMISPLEKPQHAFAIYTGLLALEAHHRHQQRNSVSVEAVHAVAPPNSPVNQQEELECGITHVNFFARAAEVSHGACHDAAADNADNRVERQSTFCVINPNNDK